MNSNILRFKGVSISKQDFEEKYDLQLTDTEWNVIVSNAIRTYEENIEEYKSLVTKHIRLALAEVGYKPRLEGAEMKYKKVE